MDSINGALCLIFFNLVQKYTNQDSEPRKPRATGNPTSSVSQGANVNATAKDARTPLHRASENGHIEVEVVQLLLDQGADIAK